jgi:triose/dihydroxyacetone kinase / FAD-AMP lyase (cyclizing)
MPGFSLTLLLLPPSPSAAGPTADVILRLLDADTSAPGWKWSSGVAPSAPAPPPTILTPERTANQTVKVRAQDVQGFARAVERACNALDKAEPEITAMDTVSGDGDCGLTLQTGAQGMRSRRELASTSAHTTCSYI